MDCESEPLGCLDQGWENELKKPSLSDVLNFKQSSWLVWFLREVNRNLVSAVEVARDLLEADCLMAEVQFQAIKIGIDTLLPHSDYFSKEKRKFNLKLIEEFWFLPGKRNRWEWERIPIRTLEIIVINQLIRFLSDLFLIWLWL